MMGYARGRIVAQKPLKRVHYLRWPAAVIQGQNVVRAETLTEPPFRMMVPAAGDSRLAIEAQIREWLIVFPNASGPTNRADPAATLCAMEVGDAQN